MSTEKKTVIAEQEEIQRIDASGDRRGGFGKEREAGPHGYSDTVGPRRAAPHA